MDEPFWMQAKKQQDRNQKELLSSMRGLNKFVQDSGLTYISLSLYHNRIKNNKTGKFVDWWNTGKMRRIDGTYGQQGRDSGFLLQEIANLV